MFFGYYIDENMFESRTKMYKDVLFLCKNVLFLYSSCQQYGKIETANVIV